MITEHDLQEAILECQGDRNPNANTCLKLASYYTILDHMFKEVQNEPTYSYASESALPSPIKYSSDTEFFNVIKDKDINKIMAVFDELMTTLQTINPRLYEGVIARLIST